MSDSTDQSSLDEKYFVDHLVYNCPFCNRRHVRYNLKGYSTFDWSNEKLCYVYFAQCHSCGKDSMHLSYEPIVENMYIQNRSGQGFSGFRFKQDVDIDEAIFYSVPTSFLVLDERIPAIIRELITEAESSRKLNLLTGASACARKAIYEFLLLEKAEGDYYEDKIKSLKAKFPSVDAELFDVLGHIQDMTSDKVHEQSWPKWSSKNLTLIIETLKAILHEVYVVPRERSKRSGKIRELLEDVRGRGKKTS